jgi:predicted dehydrogenase
MKAQSSPNGKINLAILGYGKQGEVLTNSMLQIENSPFHISVVCDIWKNSIGKCRSALRKVSPDLKWYFDYEEMLANEPDLDAVIIASPDFWHARQTNACLKAGLHVYCEKMMARTPDEARSMVRTAKETGKLLQIGHQRRSNPRYMHAYHNLLDNANLLGRYTTANAQWNRSAKPFRSVSPKIAVDQAVLEKNGFKNMEQFLNWRWFKDLSGGPISDLGSHQIDIFNWFFDALPTSVQASGGHDYYPDREWYDNVMAIFEYETPHGPARAFYQTLATTGAGGGYFEYFMGDEGALRMSENPAFTKMYREAYEETAANWDSLAKKGFIRKEEAAAKKVVTKVDVRESAPPDAYDIPIVLNKMPHTPHLENFFDAINGKAKLNSDGEHTFKSEMAVFRVNDAVAARMTLNFTKEDF